MNQDLPPDLGDLTDLFALPPGPARNERLNAFLVEMRAQLAQYTRWHLNRRHPQQRFDTEDIVQSVCARMIDVPVREFETEQHFWNWLHLVIQNLIRDRLAYHHAARRAVGVELRIPEQTEEETALPLPGHAAPPSEAARRSEVWHTIQSAARSCLDDDEYQLWHQVHILEVPQARLAEQLGLSAGAVSLRLGKINARLRDRLSHLAEG